jgi:voltage-gated potassium channel
MIRVLRLFRIFRIFKLGHFVSEGGIVVDAMKASKIKIYVFLSFIVLVTTLIGTLMYMVEHSVNPSIRSIPNGIYWAIVTITTVGYGDVIPITTMGRILSNVVMILGYGVLAVPTGIVTAEISNRVLYSSQVSTELCRNCGESSHIRSSAFCHTCGVEMHGPTAS